MSSLIVLLLLSSSAVLKQQLLKIDDPQQTASTARVPATQPQLPAAGTPAPQSQLQAAALDFYPPLSSQGLQLMNFLLKLDMVSLTLIMLGFQDY